MKEFEKWRSKERQHLLDIGVDCLRSNPRDAWRTVLEHFNKLFLEGMHPQDVIFAMQKELEQD